MRPRGVVCHTGLLGNVWVMDRFEPLEDIPSTVRLTISVLAWYRAA